MGPTPADSPMPDPEMIRRTAEEVLRRPEFQLEPRPDSGATVLDWLLRILHWVLMPIQWLIDAFSFLPFPLAVMVVVALVAIVIVLVLHITYTIVMAVTGSGSKRGVGAAVRETIRDPSILERQASEAVARGDFITGIRLLFAACLLRLETAEKRPFRPGTTNREHLRRRKDSPLFEPLKRFVDTIETRWYGEGACGPDDFEACRAAYTRIRDLAQERPHAQRA